MKSKTEVEKQPSKKIKKLITDMGREYEFKAFYEHLRLFMRLLHLAPQNLIE